MAKRRVVDVDGHHAHFIVGSNGRELYSFETDHREHEHRVGQPDDQRFGWRIAVLRRGRILAEGAPAAIAATVPAVAGLAEGVLAEHGGVGVVGDEDGHVEDLAEPGRYAEHFVEAARENIRAVAGRLTARGGAPGSPGPRRRTTARGSRASRRPPTTRRARCGRRR